MTKVSVFYPNTDGKKFNMAYYCERHVPLVSKTLGKALKGASYDQGMGGGAPGSPAPFVAIAHLYFNSMEEFGQAFTTGAPILMADIPNFTDIEPIVQVSRVVA